MIANITYQETLLSGKIKEMDSLISSL